MSEVSEGYTKDCWIAKLDLKGFFMAINKRLLWEMLEGFIKERYHKPDKELILWLTKKIVLHSPEKNCVRKMDIGVWRDIPANKSLFTNGEGYGLPIGNLSSQIFANFYLTDFDNWATERFDAYGRYVDDFFIIDRDKSKIMKSIPEIRKQLAKVEVELNPTKVYIQHYTKGASFVGGIVKPYRTYSSNRTIDNFESVIRELNETTDKEQTAQRAVQRINSYLGFLRHRRSYNIRRRILSSLDKSWRKYFYVTDSARKVCLRPRYNDNTNPKKLIAL